MKTFMKLNTRERALVGWHLFTDSQLSPPLRVASGTIAAALVTALLPLPLPLRLATRFKLGAGSFLSLLILSRLVPADRYELAVRRATDQATYSAG